MNSMRTGGGGATLTLLWENPNPGSDFIAQNISFLNNETYDYLAIVYRAYDGKNDTTSSTGETVMIAPFGRNIALIYTEAYNSYYSRQFYFETKYFTNSVHITGLYTSNRVIVPMRIFGINDSALSYQLERKLMHG